MNTENKNADRWTFGLSVLFLLITCDIVIVLVWLVYYHSYYETVSKVVGGVWTAVLAFMSYLKIRRGRGQSLPGFLRLLPVKMIIITYTVIIFLFAAVFILTEFAVHNIRITAYLNDKPQPGVVIYLNDEPCGETSDDGFLDIPPVKVGKYHVIGMFSGFIPDTAVTYVSWWRITNQLEVLFDSTRMLSSPSIPQTGDIFIDSAPFKNADITLDNKKLNKKTPVRLNHFSAGRHFVIIHKLTNGYCYQGEEEMIVEANKMKEIVINMNPIQESCMMEVRSNPTGARLFLEGIPKGMTDITLELCPGTYHMRLEKTGYEAYSQDLTVSKRMDMITIQLQETL